MKKTSLAALIYLTPLYAFAASPFSTGATGFSTEMLAILTPFAGIAVMACGVACAMSKISWWWFAGVLIGIIMLFGHQQIVDFVRGIAGV